MATTAPERKEGSHARTPHLQHPGRQLPESGDLILLLGVKTPPGQRGCTELHPIGSHHPAGIAIHHQKVRAIVVELVTIDPARQRSHPPLLQFEHIIPKSKRLLQLRRILRKFHQKPAAFRQDRTSSPQLLLRRRLQLHFSPHRPVRRERFPTFSPTTGSLPEHRISTTGEPPH